MYKKEEISGGRGCAYQYKARGWAEARHCSIHVSQQKKYIWRVPPTDTVVCGYLGRENDRAY